MARERQKCPALIDCMQKERKARCDSRIKAIFVSKACKICRSKEHAQRLHE
jgi:hypothetical protein